MYYEVGDCALEVTPGWHAAGVGRGADARADRPGTHAGAAARGARALGGAAGGALRAPARGPPDAAARGARPARAGSCGLACPGRTCAFFSGWGVAGLVYCIAVRIWRMMCVVCGRCRPVLGCRGVHAKLARAIFLIRCQVCCVLMLGLLTGGGRCIVRRCNRGLQRHAHGRQGVFIQVCLKRSC